MLNNNAAIDALFTSFNAIFNDIHSAAPTYWSQVAMEVKSTGSDEAYGWMTSLPQLREWIGERHIATAQAAAYVIRNRKFEQTIRVSREDIEDDKVGIYAPMVRMMAQAAASHPDELIFQLMRDGFEKPGFDNQPFFDADHPVRDKDGNVASVSNFGAGTEPMWFLLDTTKAVKPFIFQKRIGYTPQRLTNDSDSRVFTKDEFLYGTRARVNAEFALWQLAFGSKQALTAETYAAARQGMQSIRHDGGRIMGVMPNLLVVGPENETAARQILKAARINGSDNIWADSAELIVTPHLSE
ncbi:Mu-like prophage major head subunit gpT family protein [Palleronia caenipelagi]|nr:Mu-like prophage major head subunit gpT family protein [Palleronia caenipelagi]